MMGYRRGGGGKTKFRKKGKGGKKGVGTEGVATRGKEEDDKKTRSKNKKCSQSKDVDCRNKRWWRTRWGGDPGRTQIQIKRTLVRVAS